MMKTVEAELCFPHLNSSCRKPQTDTFEAHLVNTLLSLLSLVTTALNLLVIISISHFRQLHSTTNLILLSLAVSDFIVGFAVIPVMGNMWRSCWYFGDVVCGLFYLLPATSVMASVGTVILISVDRYVAISDPLHYTNRMNEKVVSISISVCWIYALFYAVYVSIDSFLNQEKYKLCQGQCIVHISRDSNFVLHFIIPVTVIIVLYIKVFVMAASQARAMRSHVTFTMSTTSQKTEIKAARNLGVVVFVYLICYSPYFFVAYSGSNILILGAHIQIVMNYLVYLNSCLNPLMYALLYRWFRKAIQLIVTLQIMKHGSCDLNIL